MTNTHNHNHTLKTRYYPQMDTHIDFFTTQHSYPHIHTLTHAHTQKSFSTACTQCLLLASLYQPSTSEPAIDYNL